VAVSVRSYSTALASPSACSTAPASVGVFTGQRVPVASGKAWDLRVVAVQVGVLVEALVALGGGGAGY
jgi:hypothetical protein